jgi:exopolyphosphatase/pppGpp-phosphohydrolase
VDEAIVCGGTAKTLAQVGARLVPAHLRKRPKRLPRGRHLTRPQLEASLAMLETTPAAEVRRRFGVDEGRARLLSPGGAVLLAAMDRLDVRVLRARRNGVREGAMLTYARFGEGWLEVAADGCQHES